VQAVTYLTDPAPNYLWVHPSIDRHLTMSEATAVEAQERYGLPMHPAGPLADPVWRSTSRTTARRHLREVIGLSAETPVGILLLGSLGMGDVRPAARALQAAGVHPVVLCGRNQTLLRRIGAQPGTTALGWRTDTAELVAGADVVVHNAGGLSLTESLVAGIPSLTFRPIPGHGRANARTLDEFGLVPWARTEQELTRLARAALDTTSEPWPLHEETAVDQICALLEVPDPAGR
jgi:UDP-N-acetylglucosamine:LPS N-acetylglucosamine transferase